MDKQRQLGKVRFTTKPKIDDAEVVYAPTSEKRYQELVEMFLIKLQRREDGTREEGVEASEDDEV